MEPTWGPSGADRTQVGPMLAPWSLLSGAMSKLGKILSGPTCKLLLSLTIISYVYRSFIPNYINAMELPSDQTKWYTCDINIFHVCFEQFYGLNSDKTMVDIVKFVIQLPFWHVFVSYRMIMNHWSNHCTSQHYNDVIMGAIASQITSLTIVYSTVYSGADQRKHQGSASLAFVRGIHR